MKTVILLMLLAGLTFGINAQTINAEKSKVNFKKGIYTTLIDLKNNTPSIKLEVSIIPHRRTIFSLDTSYKVEYFKLDITKNEGKKVGTILGFSDGINFYMVEEIEILKPNTKFAKTQPLGNGGYYYEFISRTKSPFNDVEQQYQYDNPYSKYLSYNFFIPQSGKVIQVKDEIDLIFLLKKTPHLLTSYENEKKHRKKLKKYFLLYIDLLISNL